MKKNLDLQGYEYPGPTVLVEATATLLEATPPLCFVCVYKIVKNG